MKKLYHVEKVEFDGDWILLTVDDHTYRIALERVSGALLRATAEERRIFQISASGYGIHWPIIDEDLSISGLLKSASSHPGRKKTA